MSDPIHITPKYYLHESGTKFYEVMEIWHPDQNRFLLVKRWGKVTARFGGGEHKIEPYLGQRACSAAADKIIHQKEGRGYARTPLDWGLHAGATTFLPSTIEKALKSHFDNYAVLAGIMHQLGLEMGAHMDTAVMDEADDIISEEPAVVPEPVRGEEWGSW
jgi:predicted DNA-binding WGR domain protein